MNTYDTMFAYKFMQEQAKRRQQAVALNRELDFRNNLLPYQKSIYNHLKSFNISNDLIKSFLSSSDNFIVNHYYELCGEASGCYALHGLGLLGRKIANEMKTSEKYKSGANTYEIERCICIATVYMDKNKNLYPKEIQPYLRFLTGR